jgi:hypothetical protein
MIASVTDLPTTPLSRLGSIAPAYWNRHAGIESRAAQRDPQQRDQLRFRTHGQAAIQHVLNPAAEESGNWFVDLDIRKAAVTAI